MLGLLIRSPWIDKILQGHKTWEIRGSNTHIRGTIALIRSGSKLIIGTCELVDVVGSLTLSELRKNYHKVGLSKKDFIEGLLYENTYAWILKNAKALSKPIPYQHPSGAIIWVKLSNSIISEIREQCPSESS